MGLSGNNECGKTAFNKGLFNIEMVYDLKAVSAGGEQLLRTCPGPLA
jgi:hypothetical protein